MCSRIDDSSITFTTNHSTGFLHFGDYIDFTHSGRRVVATVLLGDIAKTTSGREVAHGVARSVLQHVVSNSYKCIFFSKHSAIFADECKTVGVRVYHETDVVTTFAHQITDFGEVFLERFGIV